MNEDKMTGKDIELMLSLMARFAVNLKDKNPDLSNVIMALNAGLMSYTIGDKYKEVKQKFYHLIHALSSVISISKFHEQIELENKITEVKGGKK